MNPVGIASGPVPLPAAHAEPGDHPIALQSLRLGKSLQFPGHEQAVTLTLPLLPGLAPTAITGTVQLPPNPGPGTLEARSDQRLLDRVGLPQDPPAPIRISLAVAAQNTSWPCRTPAEAPPTR